MSSATREDLPFVSVIVPHYQDLKALGVCLAALDAQTYPRDRFEIVIADNNSPVGIDAVAKVVAGRAKLVLVTQKGAGPARNGAVAASTGEVLASIPAPGVYKVRLQLVAYDVANTSFTSPAAVVEIPITRY